VLMGSQSSRSAEAETCRIVVEDVTSEMTSQEVTSPEVFSPPAVDERRLSSTSSDTTVYAGSRRGSVLSVDTRRSSSGATTEFWVPASVLQRGRAHSLVPPDQLSYDDGDNDTRGTSTSWIVSGLATWMMDSCRHCVCCY